MRQHNSYQQIVCYTHTDNWLNLENTHTREITVHCEKRVHCEAETMSTTMNGRMLCIGRYMDLFICMRVSSLSYTTLCA